MSEFRYFHFREPTPETINTIECDNGEFRLNTFRAWMVEFASCIVFAYRTQIDAHVDALYREFCREHNLNPRQSLVDQGREYYQDRWRRCCSMSDLDAHEKVMRQSQGGICRLRNQMNPNRKPQTGRPDAQHVLDYIEGKVPCYGEFFPDIWSAWFEQETAVSSQEQSALRQLPYEEYLKSTYWRRVRFAMIVMARVRCQSNECHYLDSYHGDTDLLHVHHLHYKNKGCERLDNLTLLCKRCHQKVHNGNTDILLDWRDCLETFADTDGFMED
jgi:hypothetical protein